MISLKLGDAENCSGVDGVEATKGGGGCEKIAPVVGDGTDRSDEHLGEKIKHLGNGSKVIPSDPR